MNDRSLSRRDVVRTLGTAAVTLPLAGCAAFGMAPPPPTPVVFSPRPPLDPIPVEPAEIIPIARDGGMRRIRTPRPVIRPPRLPAGGTVGLVAPAGVLRSQGQLRDSVQALEGLGFRTKVGRNVTARFGFLAGTDAERARDFMTMVRDPEVDAILAVRGGWGCARILPLLDYDEIAANPKPIVGYSDITALLLAIYAKTGLVTFHGPVGVSTWQGLTSGSFVRTLVDGIAPVVMPETRRNRDRTETIREGTAEGPVVGGNLSVIAALAGTGYLPDFDGHLVFFEEIGEDAYRLDRLLVQLDLADVLAEPAGIAFGQCSECRSGGSSWSAEETIRRHIRQYRCPSVMGAPIGHVSPVLTLPIGLTARLDADAQTLEYLTGGVA